MANLSRWRQSAEFLIDYSVSALELIRETFSASPQFLALGEFFEEFKEFDSKPAGGVRPETLLSNSGLKTFAAYSLRPSATRRILAAKVAPRSLPVHGPG